MPDPLSIQIGGDHYKRHPIQPIEFCHVNQLPPALSAAVKYVVRYADKGNPLEDLQKAIHYCDIQAEMDLIHPYTGWTPKPHWLLSPAYFCHVNKLNPHQTTAICKICLYRDEQDALSDAVEAIENLIAGLQTPDKPEH